MLAVQARNVILKCISSQLASQTVSLKYVYVHVLSTVLMDNLCILTVPITGGTVFLSVLLRRFRVFIFYVAIVLDLCFRNSAKN